MSSFTRSRAALLLLVLSAALLGVSRMPWLKVTLSGAIRQDNLEATAAQLAPIVPSSALVGLAAAAALTIAGPRVRRLVLGLATLAGAMAAYGTISVLANPKDAVSQVLSNRVVPGSSWSLTSLVWMGLGLAVGLIVVSLAAQAVVATWPVRKASTGRFDRTVKTGAVDDPTRTPVGDWDALSRGEDPTRDT